MGPEHRAAYDAWRRSFLTQAPVGPRILEALFAKVEYMLNLLPGADFAALVLTLVNPGEVMRQLAHNQAAFDFVRERTVAEVNMRVPPRIRPPAEPKVEAPQEPRTDAGRGEEDG